MTFEIILTTIGLLAFIESIIVLLFPNFTKKVHQSMYKNSKTLRKAGLLELLIAIIFILIGMNI